MADLDQLRHPENLHRAWRWIKSNPDAAYKSYFRPLYQHFAVAETALLDDLADRLRRNIYEPEPSCKIFQPKQSGILRPISLLSVEDQIVYQAAVNLIAEKLYPRVVRRYSKQIFGHLYAGKSSIWFYRKWSDGYKAFNDGARQAFEDGFIYTASFVTSLLATTASIIECCAISLKSSDWIVIFPASLRSGLRNGLPPSEASSTTMGSPKGLSPPVSCLRLY